MEKEGLFLLFLLSSLFARLQVKTDMVGNICQIQSSIENKRMHDIITTGSSGTKAPSEMRCPPIHAHTGTMNEKWKSKNLKIKREFFFSSGLFLIFLLSFLVPGGKGGGRSEDECRAPESRKRFSAAACWSRRMIALNLLRPFCEIASEN